MPASQKKILTKANPRSAGAHADYWMAAIVGLLFVFGLAMLYSASSATSYSVTGHSNSYYFLHQLLYGGVAGLALAYVFTRVDYHFWQRAAPWMLLGASSCSWLCSCRTWA